MHLGVLIIPISQMREMQLPEPSQGLTVGCHRLPPAPHWALVYIWEVLGWRWRDGDGLEANATFA